MPRFSANLGFLWPDLSLPEAIRAAHAAGFDAVECHWPFETAIEEVQAALADTGLKMLGLNTRRGDISAGDNGLAAQPGREPEARAAIDEAIAYAADTGRPLYVDHTETAVMAAPMTYELDGEQYVALLAGWGGAFGLIGGTAARGIATGEGRLLVYALALPGPTPKEMQDHLWRGGDLAAGERLYHIWCSRCHGAGAVSSTGVPDLRKSVDRMGSGIDAVALHGLQGTGMPAMEDVLTPTDVKLIRLYLESRSGKSH